jgi:hypothetical protein
MEKNDNIDQQIISLCISGKKQKAIKYCKLSYYISIKEAKIYVDNLIEDNSSLFLRKKNTKNGVLKPIVISITCFFVVIILLIIFFIPKPSEIKNITTIAPIATKVVKKGISRKDSIEKYFYENGECKLMFQEFYTRLNDIDSYQHIETKYIDLKGNKYFLKKLKIHYPNLDIDENSNVFMVGTDYRAKNGFGALVKGYAEAIFNVETGDCEFFKIGE